MGVIGNVKIYAL